LGHLRARKQLEDMLVKRSKALENLESTLWTVEHAAGDVEVISHRSNSFDTQVLNIFLKLMKLYESSTVTLRTILSHPSLQRNKIDETMDALHSATEDAKDVDLTIRLAGEAEQAAIIDDDEIERELRALVQDAENEKLAAQERAALEDAKELEGRLGEVKVPADVPRAVDDRERDAEVAMGVRA
jgi:charged multivesicular body protein 7